MAGAGQCFQNQDDSALLFMERKLNTFKQICEGRPMSPPRRPKGAAIRSDDPAVAVLELQSRAAGAGIIARGVAPGGRIRFDETRRRRAGLRRLAGRDLGLGLDLGGGHLRHLLRQDRGALLVGQRADLRQPTRHLDAQTVEHRLEQMERLGLVFRQRIALRIAAEADDRAQVFERHQMLAPLAVDRLQQDLLLDHPHRLVAEGLGLLRHVGIGCRLEPLAHHVMIDAFLGRPFGEGQVQVQLVNDRGAHPLDIPLIGIGFRRHVGVEQIGDHLQTHVTGDLRDVLGFHDLAALAEDRLALIVHHVVEFQQLLADVEVAALDLRLRAFERLVHPGVDDRLAFLHAELRQHRVELVRAEDPHQVVFEREEEQRTPRVALTARPAAELVVDAAALVPLGAQNEETAGLDHLLLLFRVLGLDPAAQLVGVRLRVRGQLVMHLHLDVAAKLDVGAAAGHVGGDGDGAEAAGIGDDLRLLRVLARVQHVVRNAVLLQHLGQHLGFLDRGGADQDRLALGMGLLDRLDHRSVFLGGGAIDAVVFVLAGDGAVRRHLDHAEAVDLGEFLGLGGGGAGHPGQLVVKAEVVLEGDRGEGHVLGLDRHALFRLDRLMQTVGQAPALHHAAGEFVDQHDLAAGDDIVLILVEQLVRAQGLGDVVHDRRRFRVIERLALGQDADLVQAALHVFVALFGESRVAGLLVDRVMLFGQLGDVLVERDIEFRAVLRRARDDQRRARLVDQDAVDLVDDREEMIALHHFLDRSLHIVTQVIEAELVVRGIGDVGGIGDALLVIGLERVDDARGQAERAIDLAHPFGVAPREVVVHRDHMHALAGQRVQIGREGRHQRFALAGLHLGDIALMQEDAAHQLHVEGPQAKGAARALAAVGKGLRQQRIQAFAVLLRALLQRPRLLDDLGIRELHEVGFERVDLRHQRADRFHLAVIRCPEDLFRECSEAQHVFSAGWSDQIVCIAALPPPRPLPRTANEYRAELPSQVPRRCKGRPSECQRRGLPRPLLEWP
ncbi:hypothetical protein SDC9_06394 [bioreactor metagenome]|uniref:NAD-specific glutamate dehydrogenase n=1 Tax=bioreactor metagenome TaxID=1076179 RepID=A0A644T3W7_9ZZZZ